MDSCSELKLGLPVEEDLPADGAPAVTFGGWIDADEPGAVGDC